MKKENKFREIPYNYTSFSDREIILKYFDEETWRIIDELRNQRVTGRSARLLFENIGDIFLIDRNPYVYNDLLENRKKLNKLKKLHRIRLNVIEKSANNNPLVAKLVKKCEDVEKWFFKSFSREKEERRKIYSEIKESTKEENIHFSAFQKVAHSTDASDWRVEYPKGVVYPDSVDEVRSIIKHASKINLSIIPRGGGTGLTGGAVPVNRDTLIINTEKLKRIGGIEIVTQAGMNIPIIEVEAGVITEDAIDYCKERGYIFATDPTSAWASTIGGNIAENAGGKKCVMWGTAIDNIFSFKLIDSKGDILEVHRRDHPYRKILPADEVLFDVYHMQGKTGNTRIRTIKLKGTDIRKKSLGKDITNKALGGVPGIQKEGGDGIIISACFVLYKPFNFCRTLCLEFYGNNMINASRAIVDIIRKYENDKNVFLTALEHFDEKYVTAINYRNKSVRKEVPKAVLLIDMESNDEAKIERSCEEMIEMVAQYNTEAFVAPDDQSREVFWKDRKNLGAIARHTNAFKLNEDIVIPIEKLPQFADFIEKLNYIKELENNINIIRDIDQYMMRLESEGSDDFLKVKIQGFVNTLKVLGQNYLEFIQNIDAAALDIFKYESNYSNEERTIFQLIQDGIINFSVENDIIANFKKYFSGYEDLLTKFNQIVDKQKKRKIIVATHMHAGDGNIHVNIPVHSNDYLMMREADETAGYVMREAVNLGGVISGEHGIGLTKLRFIEKEVLDDYRAYKNEADPENMFNPGKLTPELSLDLIYTPSFNLLELEAFILRAADLENLSTSIASCVRCGKCKSVCNTHYPEGNLFYNPRNKIMGVALIIEAVLYDAQTSKSLSFRHFKKLREISDHCTICHKCQVPCPVKIDFGKVTLDTRNLLVNRKKAKFKLITSFTLLYLRKRGYYFNKILRILLLRIGYSFQRIAYYLNKPVRSITNTIVPKIGDYLESRLPRAGKKTFRETFGQKGSSNFLIFENHELPVKKTVIYFPGCGSERMFSNISFSALALLFHSGIRVIVPPEFLCCGYPLKANGKTELAEMKSYENRVIFHRMSDILSYLEIDNIIVSCGTCYEMLEVYELENTFEGAELIDISEFIVKERLYNNADSCEESVLYHDPCHTPLKKLGYQKVFNEIKTLSPTLIPYCCGEGGTLALSTPDISITLRARKSVQLDAITGKGNIKLLTTCPSCVQGLSRLSAKYSVDVWPLPVYLAHKYLGSKWKKNFITKAKKGGVEKILF